MSYLINCLIYGGVLLRTVLWYYQGEAPGQVLVLLVVYGLGLATEPLLKRRRPWSAIIYLVWQSALTLVLLLIPPYLDFLPALFVPLSLQAVLWFGGRAGFLWIGAFIVAVAGPLMISWLWQLTGLAMVLLYGCAFSLAGGYGYLIRQADSARRQNQRLLGELQVAHRQLQDYAAQLEEFGAAQERSRLAQELHDSVTQTIFSMNLTVQAARMLVDKNPGGVAGQLDRLQELAHSAAGEIRVLVNQLRPRSIADEGLAAALRRLAAERQARDGLQVCLEVSGQKELPEPVTLGLYRIAQEALNNVARHAGTAEVAVRLQLDSCPAYLEVEDHGAGFVPGQVTSQGHFGLAGMAERARELGWRWQLDAQPGRGTRIRVEEAGA